MRGKSRGDKGARRSTRLIEETPAQLKLPMYPQLDAAALNVRTLQEIRAGTFKSPWTSLEEAEATKNELVRACLARYGPGREHLLLELLDASELFSYEPGMPAALAHAVREQRRGKRGAGRPRGSSAATRERNLTIAHLVEGVHEGTGMSKEKILFALGDRLFSRYSPDRLRQMLYEASRYPQMQPLLFTCPDQRLIRRARRGELSRPRLILDGVTIVWPSGLPMGLSPAAMGPIYLAVHQGGRVQRRTLNAH